MLKKVIEDYYISNTSIKEVEERDPMKVENDGIMQGFRFFDEDCILDGEKTYVGERSNYSDWIYFGKRYSFDDIKSMYGKCDDDNSKILISNMYWNGFNQVCHTQADSFVKMEEGDMTFDEYVENISKKNETSNPTLVLNKKR